MLGNVSLLADMPTLGRAHRSPKGMFRSIALDPFRHLRVIFLVEGEDLALVRLIDARPAPGICEGFEDAG